MDKRQKQIALIAGALILAYIAYKWYANQSAASTSAGATGTTAPDTSSSDYAALAGQEQGDVAALQGQNSTLSAQEQSDVAGLGGDISGLTATVGSYSNSIDAITNSQAGLGSQIAAVAAGVTQINRADCATVATHKGGPLYKYYKAVTGKAPPANLSASNFIYQAWKSGVKASAITPAKPHPSSKNTQVAHPNGNHAQQTHTAPATQHKTATKPAKKAPVKPPAKTKPKASGTRK